MINSFKLLINNAMAAGDAIEWAFSSGANAAAAKASLENRLKQNEKYWADINGNITNMKDIGVNAYANVLEIWSNEQKEANKTLEENTTKLVAKKTKTTQKQTKTAASKQGISEEERLKAFWDYEYRIREKNIALMVDGKRKEMAAEKLRYEKTITNLNFEINEKLKSGEIELEQVNALYEAENKLHEKRMKEIKEYNLYVQQITTSMNYALSSGLDEMLSGKASIGDAFANIMSEAQGSITQGFSNAISDAFMSSRVAKGMEKAFTSAIEGLAGEDGVLTKLFNGGSGSGSFLENIGGALAGYGMGNAIGGMVTKFSADDGNKKTADIATKIGSGLGAAIGMIWGPIGSAIGGAIGGLVGSIGGSFYSKNTETTSKGVELTSRATKDDIQAREYADFKTTKKYMWGIFKYSENWTEHYSANEKALRAIKSTLRTYEWAFQDISGSFKEIGVDAGRYSDYTQIANAGAKELIANFLNIPKTIEEQYSQTRLEFNWSGILPNFSIITETFTRHVENPDLTAVYRVWEDYAKSIDKGVSEALLESLDTYINTGNNFQTWLYNFKGQESEALKLQADLAKQQVDRIMQTLGAENVTIDNYMQYREKAIKNTFDPEIIANVNALGEALMASGDATKKYEEALKGEKKTKLNMIDPFLAKTKRLEDMQSEKDDTQEKLSVQMLSTLKQMLRVSQESLEAAK